jgi:hypothetical protein
LNRLVQAEGEAKTMKINERSASISSQAIYTCDLAEDTSARPRAKPPNLAIFVAKGHKNRRHLVVNLTHGPRDAIWSAPLQNHFVRDVVRQHRQRPRKMTPRFDYCPVTHLQ